MKKGFWDQKIPTLLGLFLIVLGIGVTSYLSVIGVNQFGHAAPSENPQYIRITNITDTSFTVTYTTDARVIGSINVGKTASLGQVVLDDRDQAQGVPNPYGVHSITVRNLEPKTQYFFSITSGSTTYLDTTKPFTTTTGASMTTTPSDQIPLAGRVIYPQYSTEALIYVTAANGQTLSAIVKPTGIYAVPLNDIRTKELTSPLSLNGATIQILVRDNTDQSQVSISNATINPVPTITLGSNYDFTVSQNPVASTSASFSGFPTFALDTTVVATPQITVPQQGESFTDAQPLLQGKAVPNSTVDITIHSNDPITATVKTDANGNWAYRPTTPLAPGQHTIIIKTTDASGIIKQIQQSFTVYAEGSQVSQSATPSATVIPTIATTTPTNTPVTTPTTSPTIAQSVPTATPSMVITTTITPKPTLPPTGNESAITAGIIGLVTTTLGIFLFIATKGAAL